MTSPGFETAFCTHWTITVLTEKRPASFLSLPPPGAGGPGRQAPDSPLHPLPFLGQASFWGFCVCVFWQWEKTKDRRGEQTASQMRLNHGELGKVTNLPALWGRTVGDCACTHTLA